MGTSASELVLYLWLMEKKKRQLEEGKVSNIAQKTCTGRVLISFSDSNNWIN